MTFDIIDSRVDAEPQEKKSTFPSTWLKLGNKSPQGESKFESGALYEQKSGDKLKPFPAIILKITHVREYAKKIDGKYTRLCTSLDGVRPELKIKEPFCHRTSAAEIGEQLKEKKLDDAVIQNTLEEITDGEKLTKCAQVGRDGTLYPKCVLAKWDDLRGSYGPCKPEIRIIGYNINTDSFFQIKGSKSHLKDDTSLSKFIAYLKETKIPKQHVQVLFGGVVVDNGYAQIAFNTPTPIEDESLKDILTAKLGEVEAYYKAISEYVPKEKKQGEESSSTSTATVQGSEGDNVDEDDIPF